MLFISFSTVLCQVIFGLVLFAIWCPVECCFGAKALSFLMTWHIHFHLLLIRIRAIFCVVFSCMCSSVYDSRTVSRTVSIFHFSPLLIIGYHIKRDSLHDTILSAVKDLLKVHKIYVQQCLSFCTLALWCYGAASTFPETCLFFPKASMYCCSHPVYYNLGQNLTGYW